MSQKSVYQEYKLSPLVLVSGGSFSLGIDHPLQLVPALDADHQIIICFDCTESDRVPMPGVFRVEPICTHVFFWLVSRDEGARCFSFGAACAADILTEGGIQRLRPDLQGEYNSLYGPLQKVEPSLSRKIAHWNPIVKDGLSWVETSARLAFHRNLKECVEGVVYDERHRVADLSLSIGLTSQQWAQAVHEVEAWQRKPPFYQIRSIEGDNCAAFVWAVLAAAGVSHQAPFGFHFKPWPNKMRRIIEGAAWGKLYRKGVVQIASRSVTQEMLVAAQGSYAVRKASGLIPVS